MVSVVRSELPSLTFGRTTAPEVEVFTEVPAVFGVPDVTGLRFDWEAVRRRTQSGVRPLSTDAEVRGALSLSTRSRNAQEVARGVGLSVDVVRRSLLPMLVDAGWAVRDSNGGFVRATDAVWVSKRIVTVEAKLRDWSRALGQARRQRASADAAYIALEMSAVKSISNSLDRIGDGGVGVIGVDAASGRARVLVRPVQSARSRSIVGRMLIAERCLDMWLRGERAGQVYPVFGWTHPGESAQKLSPDR